MDDACACPADTACSERNGRSVLLVVDDEPSVLRATARLLGTADYTVHLASDASEAIELGKRLEAPPHLVVIDLWMSTHGADLARSMMAEGIASKFLFMTASEADPDKLPGPLLDKPFSADRFLATISDLLAR